MASIIIQSDNSDNVELISKLAKKLGIHVSNVSDEQSEDLALGNKGTGSYKQAKPVGCHIL